jgi:hypothetical protein
MRSALAAAAVLAALSAPAAHAATVSSLSVYSDGRDFIGQGTPRVAYPGGPAVSAGPDTFGYGGLAVGAVTGQEGVGIELAPPHGETLRPHNWTITEDYPFHRSPRPGLAVRAGSRACNVATGSLEVLDVGFDAEGEVERLWALYDHHCEGARSSAFGEIRWRAAVPESAAQVTPGVVRWPVLDSWWPAAPATVVYHGSAPAASVALAGNGAGHFGVRSDGCTGRTPPCSVEVDFTPAAPGARSARLEIVDTAGARHAVTLEGFLHGGTTSADITVLDGDVAAPAEDRGLHAYRPPETRFTGVEHAPNPTVTLFLQNADEWWELRLSAGDVAVSGSPAWCTQTAGASTVHSRSYLPDGRLRSIDTSFERRCYADERPAARGRWRFRAGDDVALPEWLVPGPRSPVAVPPADPPPSVTTSTPPPSATTTSPLRAACHGRTRLGTRRADRLRGTRGPDLIRGGAGADRIHARAGADCVFGGRGADLLVGGPGRDLLDCGPGRDRVVAGRGDRVRHCELRLSRSKA